jgi:hypothetical protein
MDSEHASLEEGRAVDDNGDDNGLRGEPESSTVIVVRYRSPEWRTEQVWRNASITVNNRQWCQ